MKNNAQLYLFNKGCRGGSSPSDLEHGFTLRQKHEATAQRAAKDGEGCGAAPNGHSSGEWRRDKGTNGGLAARTLVFFSWPSWKILQRPMQRRETIPARQVGFDDSSVAGAGVTREEDVAIAFEDVSKCMAKRHYSKKHWYECVRRCCVQN
jgi:hypothetical protein